MRLMQLHVSQKQRPPGNQHRFRPLLRFLEALTMRLGPCSLVLMPLRLLQRHQDLPLPDFMPAWPACPEVISDFGLFASHS